MGRVTQCEDPVPAARAWPWHAEQWPIAEVPILPSGAVECLAVVAGGQPWGVTYWHFAVGPARPWRAPERPVRVVPT